MRKFIILFALILLLFGCESAPNEQVEVPNVVGLYDVMIQSSLVPAGFKIRRNFMFDPAYANQEVISQSPAPGSIVDKGSVVKVTINKDPDVIYSKSYGWGWLAYCGTERVFMEDRWSIINMTKSDNIMTFVIINYEDSDGSIKFGATVNVSLSDQYTDLLVVPVKPEKFENAYRVSVDLDELGGDTPPWIYFRFEGEYNGKPIDIKLDFDNIQWKIS